MFVIVQCLNNVKKDPQFVGLRMSTKIAQALKHAGVSVTVTSLTDVFAFAVGAVTVGLVFLSIVPEFNLVCRALSFWHASISNSWKAH